jgi:hypothetical protein
VFEDTQLYEVNKIGTMVFSMSKEHSVWEGGKEWNGMEKNEYFKNILSFSLFGSLSKR